MNSIANNKIFADLSQSSIEKFIKDTDSKVVKYEKNTIIVNEGDNVKHIYALITGEIVIYKLDENGFKNIINKVVTNDFFGPTLAISKVLSPSFVETIKDCKILLIPIQNINIKTDEAIIVNKNIETLLAIKNLELNNKIYILGIKNLQERIITFLKMQHENHGEEFELQYSKQQLADYLVIDRSTLSRELKKLCDKKIITNHKNTYKLLKY